LPIFRISERMLEGKDLNSIINNQRGNAQS
jgi:hypothetical protein